MKKYLWLTLLLLALTGCATWRQPVKSPVQKQVMAPAPTSGESSCTVLECVTVLAKNGFYSWGCPATPDTVQFTWAAADSGTPAVMYIVKTEQKGRVLAPPVTLYVSADMDSVRVGVAGVSQDGDVGPWSEWSEWYRYGGFTK